MSNDNQPKVRTNIVVFGGGVTGLTAAHELAERGFYVTVFEPAEDVEGPYESPAVGGMARTQWRWVPPLGSWQVPDERFGITHEPFRVPEPIEGFEQGSAELPEGAAAVIEQVVNICKRYPILQVDIEGAAFGEDDARPLSRKRAEAVRDELNKALSAANVTTAAGGGERAIRIEARGLGNAFADDRFLTAEERRSVRIDIRRFLLPGEHGYRFFPSFYHHLFGTMKRTPYMRPVREPDVKALQFGALNPQANEESYGTRYEEIGTVFDNLRPLPKHAIATKDDVRPFLLSRQAVGSIEELKGFIDMFLKTLGFNATDIAIFNTKLLKFATSCEERRASEYSTKSWMEFIDSPHYSAGFRDAMNKWPHSLVALTAKECDAHTHGLITLQLILDQFRRQATDYTLVGPTSSAWLEPWKLYLERRRGVVFRRGRLTKLSWDPNKKEVRCSYKVRKNGEEKEVVDAPAGRYCVVALPVEEVAQVLSQEVRDAAAAEARQRGRRDDIDAAVRMSASLRGGAPAPAWNVETPPGALRHFSGVQFYFDEEVDWVEGHTYYIDSPWGLSSVAQTVHWLKKQSRTTGYRAIVSVDIGIFDRSGSEGRTAWQCSAEELAREVWKQVKEGAEARDLRLPDPAYYHVDDNLVFHDPATTGKKGIEKNLSPFLVPVARQWEQRPGEPGDYQVQLGRLVLAGTYMKTFTRLTTMEAANESAKHAVNAILSDAHREGRTAALVPCPTRSLGEREPEDLAIWKEIDKELFERGRPHFLDILSWDEWPLLPLGSVVGAVRRLLGLTRRNG